MNTAYAWAPITKVEDQADGTVLVYGPATDAGVDRDRQRMNQAWLDTAMPAWMAEGGNVREQHDVSRAVGVAVGLTRADDGSHVVAAHVVDPVAVTKVRAGVLKGFSVGIKEPQLTFGKADAPNGEIVGGSIIEVSLVDRPANPRTTFTIAKADTAGALADVAAPTVVEDQAAAELRGKAEQVLAELTILVPDMAKADAPSDIADAMTAIGCIGRLIASEATSLAAGQLSDEYDIGCLLDAIRALKYFILCESQEEPQTGTAAAEVVDSLSMNGDIFMADAVKTDTPVVPPVVAPVAPVEPAAAAVVPPAAAPDLTKVDNSDMAAIVKAAVAEATAPLRDELALVKADMVKALAMPEQGGPVGMRTASQTAQARTADATLLRSQAAAFLVKADERAREDPLLASGYRERAAELLAKADA